MSVLYDEMRNMLICERCGYDLSHSDVDTLVCECCGKLIFIEVIK